MSNTPSGVTQTPRSPGASSSEYLYSTADLVILAAVARSAASIRTYSERL
jgi:hypothetical protein